MTIIGTVSRTVLEPFHGKEYVWIYSKRLWLDIWGVWDSGWYLGIALHGYSAAKGTTPDILGQANYAFFPLYPLLIRAFGEIIGNYYIAGVILSNVFLMIAALFLYKLVRLESDDETSLRSVKYLFLFPTSFILSGVFTESLYLALIIMGFYAIKKGKTFASGISGFFAALTRSPGVLALFPFLFEYLKGKKGLRADVLFLLLIPAGFGIFSLYNYYLTGDFLAFAHITSSWGRNPENPFRTLYSGIFNGNINDKFSAYFSILCLVFLFLSYRKIGFSYWLYGFYSIAVPLWSGSLISMPRYCLVIFPLFIVLAKLGKNHRLDEGMTVFLALLQGFLMVFWSNGFPLIV